MRSAGVGFRINNPRQVVGYGPPSISSPLVQGGTLFSSNVAPRGGMKNSPENESPLSVEEGDAGANGHGGGGWLAVFVGDKSPRQRRGAPEWFFPRSNPLKSPLARGGRCFHRTWCRNAA